MSQQVKSGWGPVGVAILLGPLLYVLSIGPVALLYTKYNWNSDVPEKVYAPVIWLHDHTPLKRPIERYVEVWTGTP